MSRLVVIGSVAAASAVLLTGTAAAVGVVAAKSQPTTTASSTTQVRVAAVAPARNATVDKAIKAASAKPSELPKVHVKPAAPHHTTGSSANSNSGSHVVITYHTVAPKKGKKRIVIETITVTPSPTTTSTPSPTSSPSWHDDGGHDHGGSGGGDHHHRGGTPNPSVSPTQGSGHQDD